MSDPAPVWDLIGALDQFGSRYWDIAPVHVQAPATSDPSSIISLEQLDGLVASRHLDARLLDAGAYVDEREHRTSGLRRKDGRTWLSDPATIVDGFRAGRSIVVHSIHEVWSPIEGLAAELAQILGEQVTASLFITPGGSVTDWHADPAHNFVLQLHGTKRWLVARTRESPLVIDRPLELRLGPGDLLYVPQRFLHRVEGHTGPSIHLSFHLAPLTWSELIKLTLADQVDASSCDHLDRTPPNPTWGAESRAAWSDALGDVVGAVEQRLRALHTATDSAQPEKIAPNRPRRPQRRFSRPGAFFDAFREGLDREHR